MGKDRETVPKQRPSDSSLIKLCEVGQRASLRNLLHKVSQQAAKEQKYLLLKAIENRHEELVTVLLENGADPNVRDAIGDTPLHVALKSGQNEIAATILRYNADVNVHSRQGLTPLHYAAHQRDHDLVKKLVLKGADVNLENSEGRTPLMVVCRSGCVPLAKILLQNGSDISKTDKLGWKASDYAIIGGIYGELKSLIPEQDPEINEKDFCRTCNKREPLLLTESLEELKELDSPNILGNLETYTKKPLNSSSLDQDYTSVKTFDKPVTITTKIMEGKQKQHPVKQQTVGESLSKECGCPVSVDCSCATNTSTESNHFQYFTNVSPAISNTNLSDDDSTEYTSASRSLPKGTQKLDYVLPELPSTYAASNKISFATDRLDSIEKLVSEEKSAKLKARAYVQGLEEANENLFRVKNDLEEALHAAQKALKEREHRIEEAHQLLHDLEGRLSDEVMHKEQDQKLLQASIEDARLKDNACECLRHDKDELEKKCKELEKKLDDEKDGKQKLKKDISASKDELAKAREDADSKHKKLHNLISDLHLAVDPKGKTELQQLPQSGSSSPLDDNHIPHIIRNVKGKVENLNRTLDDQGKENDKLKAENNKLKDMIESLKADQAKKAAEMQKQLDLAKNNKRSLEDQIGALMKQVKDAQEAAEKVKNLTDSVNALKGEKDNAVQELKSEQKNVKNLERTVKDLEAENSRLRCEVARLRDCLRVTRRQQEKAETKVHELHDELQIGRATLEQCRLTPSCSRTASSADFSKPCRRE